MKTDWTDWLLYDNFFRRLKMQIELHNDFNGQDHIITVMYDKNCQKHSGRKWEAPRMYIRRSGLTMIIELSEANKQKLRELVK
jgi:hypothetical protein